MTKLPKIKKFSFIEDKARLHGARNCWWVQQGRLTFWIIHGPAQKTKREAILAWNRKVK